jgi:hypothetical protein
MKSPLAEGKRASWSACSLMPRHKGNTQKMLWVPGLAEGTKPHSLKNLALVRGGVLNPATA